MGGQAYQPSPSPGYAAPSPGLGYSPMTPGSHTPSPYTPQTPGAASGLTDALGSSDWYSPDIEVIIRDSHEDSGLCGQIGVVRGATPGEDHDSTGNLLSIDGQEGVVKLDQSGDVKLLQMKFLCKMICIKV